MKHLFSLLLISLSTSIYCQSKFFIHVNGSLNMTYRDLSNSGKTSDAMEQYFKVRRNAEKVSLREEFGVGIGMIINSNFQVQTGLFYKRFGDVEKDDLISFNENTGMYESVEKRIRHSYYHLGIPISFDYYMISWKGWDFGWRISPEINYLASSKYSIRNGENIFGSPIGYPYYFTHTNRFVFGIETGMVGQFRINESTCLNMNLLYNQHITRDFEREFIVNQRNFSLGLNVGLLRVL